MPPHVATGQVVAMGGMAAEKLPAGVRVCIDTFHEEHLDQLWEANG